MSGENQPFTFMYCNQLGGATTLWDILLTFQRVAIKPIPPENKPASAVVEEIQIAMSPGHAKVMLTTLWEMVESYEKGTAKIPLDPANQGRFEEFVKKVKAL